MICLFHSQRGHLDLAVIDYAVYFISLHSKEKLLWLWWESRERILTKSIKSDSSIKIELEIERIYLG